MDNVNKKVTNYNDSSANEATILNLLMYFDLSAFNNTNGDYHTIDDAFTKIRANFDSYITKQNDKALPEYFTTIEAYIKYHPELLDYTISNVSTNDLRYSGVRGLNAAAFSKTKMDRSRTITVVFRGTASGEWYDNGQELGGIDVGDNKESLQQKEALRYFEDTYKELRIKKKDTLILTGHSKGGTKIQYIMMMSLYADDIHMVYSSDGQGFSPEAMKHFKNKLGNKFYKRSNNIVNVSADNDYVNVLGYSLIPKENNYYFKASCKWLYKNHYPHVIFQKDGSFKQLKENPHEPGLWGRIVHNASNKVMGLPAKERNEITIGMMTIAQRVLGRGAPINKEKMNNLLMFTSAIKSMGYLTCATFETLTQQFFVAAHFIWFI